VPQSGAAGHDTAAAGTQRPRAPVLWLAAAAGLVLAWAATALPWATVSGSSLAGVVAIRGGGVGTALALVGVLATVTAVAGWATGRTRGAATVLLVLGVGAVVGCGVLVLRAIYLANGYRGPTHVLVSDSGWSTTSHGVGVAVGGAASIAVLVVGALVRSGVRG